MFKYYEEKSLIHKIPVVYKVFLFLLIIIVTIISKTNYLYIMLMLLNLILYLISNLPISLKKYILVILSIIILFVFKDLVLSITKIIYIVSIVNLFFRTTKLKDILNIKVSILNSMFIYIFLPLVLVYKYICYIISSIIDVKNSNLFLEKDNKYCVKKIVLFISIVLDSTNRKYINFKSHLNYLLTNNNVEYKNILFILSVILIFVLVIYKEVIL